ncbi:MAG: hypothetical protein SW833_19975 [Cyanobacteriota bacterium]|nr:hypothetical protein [Cyanobacteriota bacterium]
MLNVEKTQEQAIVLTTRDRGNLDLESPTLTGFNIPSNLLINGGISVVLILALAYFVRVLLQAIAELMEVTNKKK